MVETTRIESAASDQQADRCTIHHPSRDPPDSAWQFSQGHSALPGSPGFAMEQSGTETRRDLHPPATQDSSTWVFPLEKGTFRRWWLPLSQPPPRLHCLKGKKSLSGAPHADYQNVMAWKEQVSWAQLTVFYLNAPARSAFPKTKFSNFAQICRQLAFQAQNLLKHQNRKAKCLGRKTPFMQSLKGKKRRKKEPLNLEQSTTRCFISFEEPRGSAAVVTAPPAAASPGSALYTHPIFSSQSLWHHVAPESGVGAPLNSPPPNPPLLFCPRPFCLFPPPKPK